MRLLLRAASRAGGAGDLAVFTAFHAAGRFGGALRLLGATGGAAADDERSANERNDCNDGFHILVLFNVQAARSSPNHSECDRSQPAGIVAQPKDLSTRPAVSLHD